MLLRMLLLLLILGGYIASNLIGVSHNGHFYCHGWPTLWMVRSTTVRNYYRYTPSKPDFTPWPLEWVAAGPRPRTSILFDTHIALQNGVVLVGFASFAHRLLRRALPFQCSLASLFAMMSTAGIFLIMVKWRFWSVAHVPAYPMLTASILGWWYMWRSCNIDYRFCRSGARRTSATDASM